jgi:phosphate starvation-inducible protein PhoH and related proteins
LYISGQEAQRARSILERLVLIVKDNRVVDNDEIEAAIRLSMNKSEENINNIFIKTPQKKILPRSLTQSKYIDALRENTLTFGLGPAGTGKTYLAVAEAVEKISSGDVEKIILSRPAVEAGEQLGFLPGDLKDKIDPYLIPLYDALGDCMSREKVSKMIEKGKIEIAPLAFMRGRTLSHSFIILDEAQNASAMQMKMFLTRLGKGSKMVITGDLTQVDLPKPKVSGLHEALEVTKNLKDVAHIYFLEQDVIRHALVTQIVKSYKKIALLNNK